ncbi:hypothetical protein BS50DRAFT_361772 [Corynespora cassiicola Philippines]|uniref:Uncharacterized protein n=1 Tax=Corynespora cassiicola Philippines TaxID=1448308 RepID=A0A2T2NSD8_CORCC|nr:hypothetical protein BS50DRAFT_361772 [Corynespora cassiicola Philippines]
MERFWEGRNDGVVRSLGTAGFLVLAFWRLCRGCEGVAWQERGGTRTDIWPCVHADIKQMTKPDISDDPLYHNHYYSSC